MLFKLIQEKSCLTSRIIFLFVLNSRNIKRVMFQPLHEGIIFKLFQTSQSKRIIICWVIIFLFVLNSGEIKLKTFRSSIEILLFTLLLISERSEKVIFSSVFKIQISRRLADQGCAWFIAKTLLYYDSFLLFLLMKPPFFGALTWELDLWSGLKTGV
jgi:hypothetical protein